MATYLNPTVSFRLNTTGKNSFPLQIMVNLGMKDEKEKYLVVVRNLGLTLNSIEWSTHQKLPKNEELAIRLKKIEKTVKSYCSTITVEQLTSHKESYINGIKYEISRIADSIIKDKPQESIFQTSNNHTFIWIDRLKDFGFSIQNVEGQIIDPNKFYDLNYTKDFAGQMVIGSGVHPEINKFLSEPVSKKELTQDYNPIANKIDKYPIPLSEYIEKVASYKMVQIKNPLRDKREYTKLARKFEKYNSKLTLGQYTDLVGEDFLNWIKNTSEFNINSVNSFGAIIKVLKSVLIYATRRDKKTFGGSPAKLENVNIDDEMYSKQVEEVDNIYVTEERLEELNNFDIKDFYIEGEATYVKDLFIVGSYTSSRFGDLGKMFNILKYPDKDVYYINYMDDKKGVKGEIPIPKFVYKILKKYNFKFAEIDNAEFNRIIKEVCQAAGWNENVTYNQTNIKQTGERILTYNEPFYKLVSAHTMRRSFATNMYVHRKLDKFLVMSLTHHKTVKVFDSYVKGAEKKYVGEYIDKVILNN